MTIIPTFANYLAAVGLPEASGLDENEQVTVRWLQYDQEVWRLVSQMKAEADGSSDLRGLLDVLSEDVIDGHLGTGWFGRHVDRTATSGQTRGYLHPDGPPDLRLLSAHRVHELARRLYQLQSFPWFGSVTANLRTRDLSGAGFELDVLQVLHTLVGSITPKEESGVKGEDYDIHLRVGGLEIPIEVKAKDDETALTSNTVVNTVKAAASQLPKGQTGIVFLRVPPAWVGQSLEETYPDILLEATRQTSRVAAVVSVIDKMHLTVDQTAGHVTRHFDFFRHEDCPEPLWDACLQLKDFLERDLTYFAPSPPF
jgi:hypothetical protein